MLMLDELLVWHGMVWYGIEHFNRKEINRIKNKIQYLLSPGRAWSRSTILCTELGSDKTRFNCIVQYGEK